MTVRGQPGVNGVSGQDQVQAASTGAVENVDVNSTYWRVYRPEQASRVEMHDQHDNPVLIATSQYGGEFGPTRFPRPVTTQDEIDAVLRLAGLSGAPSRRVADDRTTIFKPF